MFKYSPDSSDISENAIAWTNAQISAAQFAASTDYDVIYNVDKQITNPDSVVTKTLQKATKPFTGSNAVESILELDHFVVLHCNDDGVID